MITLHRPYQTIGGQTLQSDLMKHPELDTLHFIGPHAQQGYKSLSWESLSDLIVYLDKRYNRSHYIHESEIIYLEKSTIYAQYFATIEGKL